MNHCCEDTIKKSICKELCLEHSFDFCRPVDHIVDSNIFVKNLNYKIIECDGRYKLLLQGIVCITIDYCSDSCHGSRLICEKRSLPFITLITIPPCSKIKDINICIKNCKINRCSCSELLFSFILCIDVMILMRDTRPSISRNLACFCDKEDCSFCNKIDFKDDCCPY